MGVHTGQAETSDGRYTGLAVHRAARICAAAHGSQILVSQAAETLLQDEEEDLQISLSPLGQHRLKDLDRPVSLYQVGAPDLPSKFPPPRGQTPGGAARWRRPIVLVPVALAVAAIVAGVSVLALGSGGGGVSKVDPNYVGVIDVKTNKIVAQVPVGLRPGPIATVPGAVWIGNLDDRTLTRIDPSTRTQAANVPLDNRTPTGLAATPTAVWVARRHPRLDLEGGPPVQPGGRPRIRDPGLQRRRLSHQGRRLGLGRLRKLDPGADRPLDHARLRARICRAVAPAGSSMRKERSGYPIAARRRSIASIQPRSPSSPWGLLPSDPSPARLPTVRERFG